MQLYSLSGNSQKLDGGAMFGNCPRALWSKWCKPDEENRIELACRALLVCEPSGRLVLFDAGVGAFFEPPLRERYGVVESEHVLIESLAKIGVLPRDIDVVVLSHLHFDHAGGVLTAWEPNRAPELVFPKCRYVIGQAAWQRARHPHVRDRASFIPQLPGLLDETDRLELVASDESALLGPDYRFEFSHGHTPGLMITRIGANEPGPIHFVGDLIPGVPWIRAAITMGYDRYPELLIDEKDRLLDHVATWGEWIYMPHDPKVAVCRIVRDEDGRMSAADERSVLEGGRIQLARTSSA